MDNLSDTVLTQADTIIKGSKALDYIKIIQHDQSEVQKLKQLLECLGVGAGQSKMTVAPTTKIASSATATTDKRQTLSNEEHANRALHSRVQSILESLMKEDFEQRINCVYDTTAAQRTTGFAQVAHTKGLPSFDVVLAPDFSPVTGLHAIFVSSLEVFSAVLPEPGDYEWKILKRRAYMDLDEMIEFATLLSAGFDLE